MPFHNIKAVLFDLDGTLRHDTPTGTQVSNQYLIESGFQISAESFIRANRWEHFYFASSPEIQKDIEAYQGDDFWVNFSRRRMVALGIDPRQAENFAPKLSAYMKEHYKPRSFVPDEVFEMLERLKDQFILGVVSNRETPFSEELDTLNLTPYFKFSLAAGEVDSYKPDARIFESALEKAEVSAREAVYVGDNYYADIVGSLRAGLRPVLYDPGGIFPEADCDVITTFRQLTKLLQ